MPVLYQNNFNGGEISPEAYGLVNYESYIKSCARTKNFLTNLINTATYRAGTRYVATAKDLTANRLLPFKFSEAQSFVLEAGNQYVRFLQDRGLVVDGGSPYEISSIYSAADLDTLKYTQRLDLMFFTHQDYPPHTIQRNAATDWDLQEYQLRPAPFLPINKTDTTLDASATTGNITIVASEGIFTADDVGSQYYFEEDLESIYDQWEQGKSYTSGDFVVNGGHLYKAAGSGTSQERAPIHIEGTQSDGGVNWEYIHSGWGYAAVSAYTSATQVSASVLSTLPSSATDNTKRWSESVFSNKRGQPKVCRFFADRLSFGGNEDFAMSVVGDYPNFAKKANLTAVTNDSAIIRTLAGGDAQFIRWMIDDARGLVMGTESTEWLISSGSTSEVITPSNVRATPLSDVGGADIQAIRTDNQVLFAADSEQAIRSLRYEFSADGFIDTEPSILAKHFFKGNIKRFVVQKQPESRVWIVTRDGGLFAMTSRTQENVIGFNEVVLGGAGDANGNPPKVIDACVVPSPNAGEQDLYLLVERFVNGSTVRYIEVMEAPYRIGKSPADMLYLDCGITYSGAEANIINGLGFLEGSQVTVYNQGNIESQTVNSGQITLNKPTTKCHIGYSYEGILESLPYTTSTRKDHAGSIGLVRSMSAVKIMLWESLGGKIVSSDNTIEQPFIYDMGQPMGAPQSLFSGFQSVNIADSNKEDLRVKIVQDLPVPMTVQAIIYDMTAGRL